MASKRRRYRTRKINPTYYVFCEGKTEEAYVNLLKSHFRLASIVIKSKVSGSNVSSDEIEKYRSYKETHEKDKVFLMYDGDISTVVDRLMQIDDAEKLISTPCIELWFLLHFKNQATTTSCKDCIQYLSNRAQYRKGKIPFDIQQK